MGYRAVYGVDPLRAAFEAVSDSAEKERKRQANVRVDLFYESVETILRREISRLFNDPDVAAKLMAFARLAGSPNLFRRTIDEVAGPAYQIPPTRKVRIGEGREPDKEQTQRYRKLVKATKLDRRLDLACHLGHACNTVFLSCRYSERLGPIVDVLTPAQVTVIPDPDDLHRELAVIYEREARTSDGRPECVYVYWDDAEMFLFNQYGARLPVPSTGEWRATHTYGRIPFVPVHLTDRPCGTYWDTSSGNALVAGALAAMILTALTLKLHKSSGFRQPVVTGDIVGFPKGQTFDEENAVVVPEGTRLEVMDLVAPASHYLETLRDIVQRTAANYGINLDRLNAKSSADASDVGLQERREDAVKIFRCAEEEVFDLLRILSSHTPDMTLSDAAVLEVDFGELTLRTDPMGTLDLWERQIKGAMRNELDNIRALNPEIDSDEEAWEEFDRNLEIHAQAIERMRALNMNKDAGPDMPGQDAQENGALGPKVRDEEITSDEAAEQAAIDNDED